MELATETEIYAPSIDEMGNYVDKIPHVRNGIRCPCGSRKDKVYDSYTIFSAHIKTKCHQKWLKDINTNKANYYVENAELKTTLQNQRMIIAKMEKDLQNKSMTIDYLTNQIIKQKPPTCVNNLLDFDN